MDIRFSNNMNESKTDRQRDMAEQKADRHDIQGRPRDRYIRHPEQGKTSRQDIDRKT